MFSEAEDVEADLICQLDLLDEIAQALVRSDGIGTGLDADITECIEAEFHDVLAFDRVRGQLVPASGACQ